MTGKIPIWLLATILLTTAPLARAQQPKKIPRIGFLSAASVASISARSEAFRQGLRELAYEEGKNIVVEYRFADGKLDHLRQIATDLARLQLDVIVTGGPTATHAAKRSN
jgi:putative tryptophan/tyrosine transport system substrate-binding protein